ncbi:hypothetical protein QA811_43825 [Streptomyces sp. B21-102]|uniref:hypothetical protein n=1 Tax=Streptomyces sp. B21-102 TaxID=3039416 RepID=UPI002FF0880D
MQDTPTPRPATLSDQLTRRLPARLPQQFPTVRCLAVDDRTPAVDAWFARATAACRSR